MDKFRATDNGLVDREISRIDKVAVIKQSLLCFNLSWFGLIPFFGIIPAILSLAAHKRVREECGLEWNPAAHYAVWGKLVSCCGLFISAVLWLGLVYYMWHCALAN